MDRVHFHEPDMAIDAGPRIPAAATRLDIGTDGNLVWLAAIFQVGRQVVAQTHISIGALAQQVPIDPDLAVHVDTVKIHGDFLSLVRFGKRERFAIPTDASGKIPDRGSAGHRRIVGLLNAPVVWNIKSPPLGIVENWVLGTGCLAQMEGPILGEANSHPGVVSARPAEARLGCCEHKKASGHNQFARGQRKGFYCHVERDSASQTKGAKPETSPSVWGCHSGQSANF